MGRYVHHVGHRGHATARAQRNERHSLKIFFVFRVTDVYIRGFQHLETFIDINQTEEL
jgi:hypothetical protein